MMTDLSMVDVVNRCNVSEMEKVGLELDPQNHDSCEMFRKQVAAVHAALVHSFRIVSYVAIRDSSPTQAAAHWKMMGEFCDLALKVLKSLNEKFPHCGTRELYDLTLDYNG